MTPEDFYTVPRSEEGVRFALLGADGKDSGQWLLIHGSHSHAFNRSVGQLNRALAALRVKYRPKDGETQIGRASCRERV